MKTTDSADGPVFSDFEIYVLRRWARLSWMSFNLGSFWLEDENAPQRPLPMAIFLLNSGRLEQRLVRLDAGDGYVQAGCVSGYVDPDMLGRWTRLTRAEKLAILRQAFQEMKIKTGQVEDGH